MATEPMPVASSETAGEKRTPKEHRSKRGATARIFEILDKPLASAT